MKPIILTFARYYLPGYKSGGPVRALSNLVERLGDSLDFRIVTRDRDVSDPGPYPAIAVDTWNDVGKAKVYYAGAQTRSFVALIRLIRRTPYDLLYVNSFFDPGFTLRPLLARHLGLIERRPVLMAPRGEFSPGALTLKQWKKNLFIWAGRTIHLFSDLTWQASSDHEAADIHRAHLKILRTRTSPVVRAVDIPTAVSEQLLCLDRIRGTGEPLRVLFLSRISPMKNLEFVLRTLTRVQTPVTLSIVGPPEDNAYWQCCQNLIAKLPSHVSATYHGHAEHARIPGIMAEHDLFFLPTLGENFGHAIAEAFAAGLPALISDRTPWRGLALEGVGWDLPLTSEPAFAQRIDECSRMSVEEYLLFRNRAREFAKRYTSDPSLIEDNRRLFMDLIKNREN